MKKCCHDQQEDEETREEAQSKEKIEEEKMALDSLWVLKFEVFL